MKICARILFLLLLAYTIHAQTRAGETREESTPAKIALTDILGDWYRADSLKTKITFSTIANVEVQIEGIKHGVGNYCFRIEHDSILAHGIAANWPPYDCTLKLLPGNTLELLFYSFHYSGSTRVLYRRE